MLRCQKNEVEENLEGISDRNLHYVDGNQCFCHKFLGVFETRNAKTVNHLHIHLVSFQK